MIILFQSTSTSKADTKKSAAGTSKAGASKAGAIKSVKDIDVSGLNGTNLLTKGVAAAARLINMNKKEYTDEDQDEDEDSAEDEDQDEDEDSDKRVTIIHSIHELSLKGKCFI